MKKQFKDYVLDVMYCSECKTGLLMTVIAPV